MNPFQRTFSIPDSRTFWFLVDSLPKWTDMFKAIADKYGLGLEGDWNKILIPQQGSHAEEYHQWVYNTLINIDKIANGNKEKFLELFDRKIKQIVLNNPWIVNRQWWKTILKRKP